MDTPLLGFTRSCVLIEVVLAMFSCSSMEELHEGFLSGGGGKMLVILLSGSLGSSGGFFMIFRAAIDSDIVEG